MKTLVSVLLALACSCAMPITSFAKDNAGVTQLLTPPTTLREDAAYLLMKTSTAKSGMFPIQHVLLRIPSNEELAQYRAAKKAAYEAELLKLTKGARDGRVPTIDEFAFDYPGKANTFVVNSGKFLEDGELRTILLEVPEGTYVLYGTTVGNRGLVTCNCLGTVKFEARRGAITNIGSLYADKVHNDSPVPHLEDNLGPQMFQYGFVLGEALAPDEGAVPVSLQRFKVEPASFEAVGQFYESGATSINRLAPVPGILAYEKGRPFDLKKGKLAE